MTEIVAYAELSWPEAERRIAKGAPIFLPLGATEQHGRHMAMNVDVTLPSAICERVARRVGGLVLPALPYGNRSQPRTGGGRGFPGTINISAGVFSALVRDIVVDLHRQGARRIVLVNGHYENVWPSVIGIELALDALGIARDDVTILRIDHWEMIRPETIARIFPDGYPGIELEHASVLETSMMLALRPDLVALDASPTRRAGSLQALRPLSSATRRGAALRRALADRGVIRREGAMAPRRRGGRDRASRPPGVFSMTHALTKHQPVDAARVPRFAGIATFMRLPLVSSAEGLDIAFYGIPWDDGTTNRAGARHGPREVRNQSSLMRRVHHVSGTEPFSIANVADIGDLAVNPIDLMDGLNKIEAGVAAVVAAGAIPFGIGGDHLTTLPAMRAVAKQRPVGMIHFDAHSDTNDKYFGENPYTHGTPFRRAIEEGSMRNRRCRVLAGVSTGPQRTTLWSYWRVASRPRWFRACAHEATPSRSVDRQRTSWVMRRRSAGQLPAL